MAKLLLKKSYLLSTLKEVSFKDLWGSKGVFTTMRMIGKPPRLLLYKFHFNNLIASTKKYRIKKNNLENILTNLIKKNSIFKGPDNLFRIALNRKLISISIRKRPKPKNDFNLLLFKYKRTDPKYKNLYYKKILANLNKLDNTKYDIALCYKNKILETGTSNILFIKEKKIFSPKNNCYFGNNIKYLSKKVNINFKDILVNEISSYDEILLIGSGKGIVSVKSIKKNKWRRKSKKIYFQLTKLYNKI